MVTRKPPNDLQRLLIDERGHGFGSATGAAGVLLRLDARHAERAKPHRAGHQAFRHEDDDGDEDRAEHEIPARRHRR